MVLYSVELVPIAWYCGRLRRSVRVEGAVRSVFGGFYCDCGSFVRCNSKYHLIGLYGFCENLVETDVIDVKYNFKCEVFYVRCECCGEVVVVSECKVFVVLGVNVCSVCYKFCCVDWCDGFFG